MRDRMGRTLATSLAIVAFLALGAREALAHGDATLEVAVSSVAAGGTLALRGDDFGPGEKYRLVLKGALQEYELATVSAKTDSTFTADVVVPEDVRPGQYRLLAIAPDGDEVASVDMMVSAAAPVAEEAEEGGLPPAEAAPVQRVAREARADDIVVERSRGGLGWGVIGLVIGLAGGLGAGLLAKS